MNKKDLQELNDVLAYQKQELSKIDTINITSIDKAIDESEELLRSLGYDLPERHINKYKAELSVPEWDALLEEARSVVGNQNKIEDLFTKEELESNALAIKAINHDFKQVYKLDKYDYLIAVSAGLLSALVDILLVGIPSPSENGVKAGPLSNWIRDRFDKWIPEEKVHELEGMKSVKVPFDAQDNRHTKEFVAGLSTYYHRLYELGHDPLIGFVVGVYDIMHGSMTTIDQFGNLVNQTIDVYNDRIEPKVFKAIAKEFLHLKSDVNTAMGLPAPLMGLFNLIQTGPIVDEQTLSDIIRNMYYQGYDFIHACSLSIPVIIIEVVTRICYTLRRLNDGIELKDAIAISTDREKNPKLGTILFIAHSIAAAANAGKIYFASDENKLQAINYAEWIAFAINSYKQLKWAIIEKPKLAQQYLDESIYDDFGQINQRISQFAEQYYILV